MNSLLVHVFNSNRRHAIIDGRQEQCAVEFSIATCFQRSRRVVFAESTIASSNILVLAFSTTRLGSTKSGRRPPVTACSSKAIRPSRRSLDMCCSKERPARDFRCWLALKKVASKSGNPRTTEETISGPPLVMIWISLCQNWGIANNPT